MLYNTHWGHSHSSHITLCTGIVAGDLHSHLKNIYISVLKLQAAFPARAHHVSIQIQESFNINKPTIKDTTALAVCTMNCQRTDPCWSSSTEMIQVSYCDANSPLSYVVGPFLYIMACKFGFA